MPIKRLKRKYTRKTIEPATAEVVKSDEELRAEATQRLADEIKRMKAQALAEKAKPEKKKAERKPLTISKRLYLTLLGLVVFAIGVGLFILYVQAHSSPIIGFGGILCIPVGIGFIYYGLKQDSGREKVNRGKDGQLMVEVYDIRPADLGGIHHFHPVPLSEIKRGMVKIRKLGGGSFFVRKFDEALNDFVPYQILPDRAEITPEMYASVFDHPYPKLAALKLTTAQQIKQWIPVIVVALGLLALLLVGGS